MKKFILILLILTLQTGIVNQAVADQPDVGIKKEIIEQKNISLKATADNKNINDVKPDKNKFNVKSESKKAEFYSFKEIIIKMLKPLLLVLVFILSFAVIVIKIKTNKNKLIKNNKSVKNNNNNNSELTSAVMDFVRRKLS
ncbi:MAG: hypothetical protein PHV68_01375 [Candidatus Gastranaerophilales bacterium]|nr:hypothetical protein [Candidatus Gastranaerophilales bacterium]